MEPDSRFLARIRTSISRRRTVLALAGLASGAILTAYLGAVYHPEVGRPSSAEAERAIAESLQVTQPADDLLAGDYVVERFYALEKSTGRRVVLDVCRGRVRGVVVSLRGDWTDYTYDLILDRARLEPERKRLDAFIRDVAPVEADREARYLGLQAQSGPIEVLSLNYDGTIPDTQAPFTWGDGDGIFTYLAKREAEGVPFTHFLSVDGNNYFLTSIDLSPNLREPLGITQGLVLGQLLLIDRTSRESSAAFLRASP